MTPRPGELVRRAVLSVSLLVGACSPAPPAPPTAEQIEEIRQLERDRLRSLVDADVVTARRLHADDFQLINPVGVAISKTDYLSDIETGVLDYRAWEAGDIAVRIYDSAAVIRYLDVRFEVDLDGQPVHRGPMYHTNLWERRAGQWQMIWSQASGLLNPPAKSQP